MLEWLAALFAPRDDAKVKALESQLVDSQTRLDDLAASLKIERQMVDTLMRQYEIEKKTSIGLQAKIDAFNKPVNITCPDFIDQNGFVTIPSRVGQVGDQVKQINIPHAACFGSNTLEQVVNEQGWKNTSPVIAVQLIAKFVASKTRYVPDGMDNWQEPEITWHLKQGDCDDLAILWCEFCRLTGIGNDQAFIALGMWVGREWHMFPVFRQADGSFVYFEVTAGANETTGTPLKGSDHQCQRGIFNWAFKGAFKEELWK